MIINELSFRFARIMHTMRTIRAQRYNFFLNYANIYRYFLRQRVKYMLCNIKEYALFCLYQKIVVSLCSKYEYYESTVDQW